MLRLLLILCVAVVLPAPSLQGACDASRPEIITVIDTPIASPNYPLNYPDNSLCEYRFTYTGTGENEIPIIVFSDFGLEDSAGCTKDFVSIYDGADAAAPLLGTYCGSRLPPEITGASNSFFLRFSSDASVNSEPGFRATFTTKAKDTACVPARPKIIREPSGNFSTPGFPTVYPNNLQCEWHIIAPADQKILITFVFFALEACCTCDYLRIYDGGSTTAKLYGSWTALQRPPEFTSRSNEVYVQFISDASLVDSGVLIKWQFV